MTDEQANEVLRRAGLPVTAENRRIARLELLKEAQRRGMLGPEMTAIPR